MTDDGRMWSTSLLVGGAFDLGDQGEITFGAGPGIRFLEREANHEPEKGIDTPAQSARGIEWVHLEGSFMLNLTNALRVGLHTEWTAGCFVRNTYEDGSMARDTCSDDFLPFFSFGVGFASGVVF